jgi:hypothetical protein
MARIGPPSEGSCHPPEVAARNITHPLSATQFGISAYDACFVFLAKQMKVKLVTEDTKLQAAVPSWTISLAGTLA